MTVRVLNSTTNGVPEGCLETEIVASSEFANGRLKEVYLLEDDLEQWAEVLDRLASGRSAVWTDDGRNPESPSRLEARTSPRGRRSMPLRSR